ncbi:MAG TPA: IS110 family transposase [Solirubrobacteraceae bacterium]|jgi:transposase
MDAMVERCAGLDVHRDDVVATVRVPGEGRRRWDQETRTFRATLGGLAQLAAWLAEAGVTLVGMESTGVYWRTVFQALEERFECWLLNAHHLRNVPGRKTDVKDSEWICQLVQHGLVRPSFVPPPEIRRLRDLTRLRKAQSNERGRTIQRLEKVFQDAGIKLSSVASTTYSKSARAMLEALLSGVTDPEQLAELSKGKMRAKIPQLREALASRFQIEHHGILVAQLLAHIDTLDIALQNLTERIEFVLEPHAEIIELLCTIPGVQAHAAQVLIAECGLDMTLFPTVGHFASWAGACPGHNESGGRRRSARTRPGPPWLTSQLTECARAAVRTKGTYLAAHFAQLRGRRGEPKAIGAIRHDLLVAYYHIVRDRVPFRDLGPDWQRKRYSVEHRAQRLQRQLEALGYAVTLEQTEPAEQAA